MRDSLSMKGIIKMLIVYICVFFLPRIATALDTILPGQFIIDGETLVSSNGVFELGFFGPGKSRSRYLGIWYKIDAEKNVVWVANRETPISDSLGVLSFNARGTLVLVMNTTKDTVWSSNNASTTPKNPVAVLLDSGNLVVKEKNDDNPSRYLWQSFDYPGDTMLAGMRIGKNFLTGQETFLSSWKSTDEPSKGDYTLGIDPRGFPQMLARKGNATQIRVGSWNGIYFSGLPGLGSDPDYTYTFVLNQQEVYHKYEVRNSSFLLRLVLDPVGIVERLQWSYQKGSWAPINFVTIDSCDHYALCGSNAGCNIGNTPHCRCLEGFVPKSQGAWDQSDWSDGCVRRIPPDCEKGTDGFLKYQSVKLPDTTSVWYNSSSSLMECKSLCSKNCSCTAYANSDVRGGGSGCLLWFHDLVDIREFPTGGQDLYIRLAASELESMRHSGEKRQVIIIVTCTIVAILGILAIGCILYMRKHKLRSPGKTYQSSRKLDDDKEGSNKDDMDLPIYDLNSIADATDNFSDKNKLGVGGFGPVYKGTLMDGQEVAVKRLSKGSGQGLTEFKNEVVLIAKLQHRNLVKLLGCCIEKDERILIYEYMPNQSLDYFIFDKMGRELLDWNRRSQIIGGTARGLLYLHQDSRLRIIHRDLKVSNILLDNEMNPKISDFGMARMVQGDQTEAETNRIVGTYGYMSPEYAIDGIFSVKSDVYSFGVLVLEIISGKKNRGFCHSEHKHNLLGHAWRLWTEERAVELIDKLLDYSSVLSEIIRCIHVGLLCVQQAPEDRPNMSSVVVMLSSEGSLPQPRQPGFFSERNLPESESSSSNHQSSSKQRISTTNEITFSLLDAR